MPYPTEHACRMRQPNEFKEESFRRLEREHEGKKYFVIQGISKSGDNWEDQAYRYPKGQWTSQDARDHCRLHKGIDFESAIDGSEARISIYNRAWAISIAGFNDLEAFACGNGNFEYLESTEQLSTQYKIKNRKAIIPICGIIEHRKSLFSLFMGGVSTDDLIQNISSLAQDDGIDEIILDFDSPGGVVDGVQEVSDLIFRLRDKKPFKALVNSNCLSAAYWIASACNRVFLSSGTSRAGSIGIVSAHKDITGAEEQMGIKTTEIYAGHFKRVDSQYRPLSLEGRAVLQSQVDYLYSIFINEIAKNRGVSLERVLGDMADGRIFIGEQAIAAGLADRIFTLSDLIKENNAMAEKPQVIQAQENMVELETLKRENEDLKKQVEELKKQIADMQNQGASKEEEKKQSATIAERNRIKALEEIAPTQCSALLAQAKAEGWEISRAAVEFLKASKTFTNNDLKAESVVVPHMSVGTIEDEQQKTIQYMVESINKSRRKY